MEIIPILTIAELENLTMNEKLLNVCQEKPETALKIINQVSVRMRGKVCPEMFRKEENSDTPEYEFPQVLKMIWASLCESYYQYFIVDKSNDATRKLVSEKIDDYQYTYSDSTSWYSFFGIPTDKNILDMLERYDCKGWKGFREINLH